MNRSLLPTLSVFSLTLLSAALAAVTAGLDAAAAARPRTRPAEPLPLPPLVGRWDLTVRTPAGDRPSWLQVERSGWTTLVGSFVGSGGSARPISRVDYRDGRFRFTLPVQWEEPEADLRVEGSLIGDRLSGRIRLPSGEWQAFTGERAPKLERAGEPRWAEPVALFDGRSLAGWKPRHADRPNGWKVENGLLRNAAPGNDLVTTRGFTDFRLHAEFRYPRGSNSGIYLRGRYEAQVEDNYGQEPDSHRIGGIYGFLTPRINAARPAGEWQTYDLTLVGRRVTVVLNGETVIDRQEIPGVTGGALDSREGEPGPIMLQGDHGPVEFRSLVLTPAL